MLKVVLTIDVEDFISFAQQNPRWTPFEKFKGKINSLIKTLRYNKNGFQLVYKTILENSFPASFMLVGSMFKPLVMCKFIDWGYHSFNHIPLTLISDEELETEVKNIFGAVSFTAPMWMVEDKKNPERVFAAMKKEGYKITVYKGLNDGINHSHCCAIKKPQIRHGIKCVHLSNCFEGNSSQIHIKKVLEEIRQNAKKDAAYCLSTHDFTHKNTKNLKKIITTLKGYKKKGLIKIVNLKQLADEI